MAGFHRLLREFFGESFGVFISRYRVLSLTDLRRFELGRDPAWGSITSEPERTAVRLFGTPGGPCCTGGGAPCTLVLSGWQPSPSQPGDHRKAFSVAVLRNAIRKARQTKCGEIGRVALQVEANYLIAG